MNPRRASFCLLCLLALAAPSLSAESVAVATPTTVLLPLTPIGQAGASVSREVPLSFVSAEAAAARVSTSMVRAPTLSSDPEKNTVICEGSEATVLAAEALLRAFDVRPAQVHFEIRAFESDDLDAARLMIRKLGWNDKALNKLVEQGELHLISAPSLTTKTGQTATVRDGATAPSGDPLRLLELSLLPTIRGDLLHSTIEVRAENSERDPAYSVSEVADFVTSSDGGQAILVVPTIGQAGLVLLVSQGLVDP